MKAHQLIRNHLPLFFGVLFTAALASCEQGNKDTEIDEPNDQDKTFAVEASYSNLAEIRMGELAQSKASSEEVATFGEYMVAEHTKALQQLKNIADSLDVAIPDSLKAAHEQMREQLASLEGAAFDSAYISAQVTAHEQAKQLFERAEDGANHPSFQAYATSTLEHINAHLQRVKEMKDKMDAGQLGMQLQ